MKTKYVDSKMFPEYRSRNEMRLYFGATFTKVIMTPYKSPTLRDVFSVCRRPPNETLRVVPSLQDPSNS